MADSGVAEDARQNAGNGAAGEPAGGARPLDGGQLGSEISAVLGAPPAAGATSDETSSPDSQSSTSEAPPADEELSVRDPGPDAPSPDVDMDPARIREAAHEQAQAIEEDASKKAAAVVRTEVRRILGIDGRIDFEAESVQHIMGLAREGERVDPELEKELRAELDALGLNLDIVKLRYESMSQEDRRQLTTFQVQQAFLRVVERVDKLASQASLSLGHRIRRFDAEARDQLKLVAALRVLLETEQGKVEELIVGFRKSVEDEVEGLREVVTESRRSISDKVKDLQTAFDDTVGHLRSTETRVGAICDRLDSAGSSAEAVEQQAARVMAELQRADGSARVVWRLALIGGVTGSAVGGFVAFLVMLLLWAATSG